jgi:hypothetical protein
VRWGKEGPAPRALLAFCPDALWRWRTSCISGKRPTEPCLVHLAQRYLKRKSSSAPARQAAALGAEFLIYYIDHALKRKRLGDGPNRTKQHCNAHQIELSSGSTIGHGNDGRGGAASLNVLD